MYIIWWWKGKQFGRVVWYVYVFGVNEGKMTSGKQQCLAVGDEDGDFVWGFPRVFTAEQ